LGYPALGRRSIQGGWDWRGI